MTPIVMALPVLYYFLNRFRGTLGAGGPIVGAITGVIVFLLTSQPYLAVGTALAYAIGEAPGWGRWIKLFNKDYSQDDYWKNHREPSRGKAIHKLANKIAKESKDYKRYAFAAMALRGLLWWLPVGLVGTLLGYPEWLLVSLLGGLQPACIWLARKRDPFWKYQEHFTGVLHGVMLALYISTANHWGPL